MLIPDYFTTIKTDLPTKSKEYLCLLESKSGWRYKLLVFYTKTKSFDVVPPGCEVRAWAELETPHLLAEQLKC